MSESEDADTRRGDDRELEEYEQPHPGSTGHETATDEELPVEPEVDESDGGSAERQSREADQESKHSHPASDPPADY